MSDEHEASGERMTLPPEYDSAFLQNGSTAPTETLTVYYENPSEYLREAQTSLRKAEAKQQLEKGLSLATPGVLPQYTFRQEYVVYDSSQVSPSLLGKCEFALYFPHLIMQSILHGRAVKYAGLQAVWKVLTAVH